MEEEGKNCRGERRTADDPEQQSRNQKRSGKRKESGEKSREKRRIRAVVVRRIIAEELSKAGMNLEELRLRPSTPPAKLRMARRLRQETPLSLKPVAESLGIGIWKHLSKPLSDRSSLGGQLRDREKITSPILAWPFVRWLRCSLLTDPRAGYARRSRLASSQNSCAIIGEVIFSQSLTLVEADGEVSTNQTS